MPRRRSRLAPSNACRAPLNEPGCANYSKTRVSRPVIRIIRRLFRMLATGARRVAAHEEMRLKSREPAGIHHLGWVGVGLGGLGPLFTIKKSCCNKRL